MTLYECVSDLNQVSVVSIFIWVFGETIRGLLNCLSFGRNVLLSSLIAANGIFREEQTLPMLHGPAEA